MPANITGIVFNDLNSNGILEVSDPRIANTWLAIEDPNFVCTYVQTNALGEYTFSLLTTPGDYTISETAVNSGTCPASVFTQPAGFSASTTVRMEVINVTQADIDNDVTLTGRNYGHDNPVFFNCAPVGYTVVLPIAAINSQLVETNLVTGAITIINPDLGSPINAIGYNTLDSLIYGIDSNTDQLLRITLDGIVTDLGVVVGLPAGIYQIGDIDSNGQLYLYRNLDLFFYVIDVNQNSATFGQLVATIATPQPDLLDWSFNPLDGMLYGVNGTTGGVSQINPVTGAETLLATIGLPNPSTYPSSYMDSLGTLFVLENVTGDIYRIVIAGLNATAVLFSQTGLIPQDSDGAFCSLEVVGVDFGDAPDTALGTGIGNYNTLLASNGPRHQIINELFLGAVVTQEFDAYQSVTAIGDDIPIGIQDDAVTFPLTPILTTDSTYSLDMTVTNNTGQDANLYVWIDFNENGIFEGQEAASAIIIPTHIAPSQVTAIFNLPNVPLAGTTYVRARITTDTLINANAGDLTLEDTRSLGAATDGEVEDYIIEILEPQTLINPTKTSDKNIYNLNEIVNYTIVIPNSSIYEAENLVLRDILPTGLSLVFGSFSYNGIVVNNANLVTGVPLGNLLGGEDIIVAFSAIVDNDSSLCGTTLSNQAVIELNFFGGAIEGVFTNLYDIFVECISLEVVKEADKTLVIVGEIVTYTLTITNTGNVPLDNVILTDEIQDCASFVMNSVVINAAIMPGLDPEVGIPLGTINPDETVVVSFSVMLDSICCPPRLSNRANVAYEYTITDILATGSEESNLVIVNTGPTSFKQLSKDELLKIPCQKPDVESVLSTIVDIEIVNARVIKTLTGLSNEGQNLTGWKLIIEGVLNQKIEYVALLPEQSVHSAHFSVPFSTFIILPEDFVEGTELEVEGFVEDVYTILIDPRTVFKNVTFRLLVIQKLY